MLIHYVASESLLRRALFEDTGGTLITIPDIKVFLPPIGNLTVYICASLPSLSYPDVTFQTSSAHISVFVKDGLTHSYLSSPRSYLILCAKVAHILPPAICSTPVEIRCSSLHPASELFLQRMMVLYVASHYKNQPDVSVHHLFVFLPQ